MIDLFDAVHERVHADLQARNGVDAVFDHHRAVDRIEPVPPTVVVDRIEMGDLAQELEVFGRDRDLEQEQVLRIVPIVGIQARTAVFEHRDREVDDAFFTQRIVDERLVVVTDRSPGVFAFGKILIGKQRRVARGLVESDLHAGETGPSVFFLRLAADAEKQIVVDDVEIVRDAVFIVRAEFDGVGGIGEIELVHRIGTDEGDDIGDRAVVADGIDRFAGFADAFDDADLGHFAFRGRIQEIELVFDAAAPFGDDGRSCRRVVSRFRRGDGRRSNHDGSPNPMRCRNAEDTVVFVHRELIERTAGDSLRSREGERFGLSVDFKAEDDRRIRRYLGFLVVIVTIDDRIQVVQTHVDLIRRAKIRLDVGGVAFLDVEGREHQIADRLVAVGHEIDVFRRQFEEILAQYRVLVFGDEVLFVETVVDLVVIEHEVEHRTDHPTLDEVGVRKRKFAFDRHVVLVGRVEYDDFRAVQVITPEVIVPSALFLDVLDRVFVGDEDDLVSETVEAVDIALFDLVGEEDVQGVGVDQPERLFGGDVEEIPVGQERVALHDAVDLVVGGRIGSSRGRSGRAVRRRALGVGRQRVEGREAGDVGSFRLVVEQLEILFDLVVVVEPADGFGAVVLSRRGSRLEIASRDDEQGEKQHKRRQYFLESGLKHTIPP